MRVIPSCDDLARGVSDGSYTDGAWHVRLRLRMHMMVCWVCRRYTAQVRWIDRAAKSVLAPSPADADPSFKRRLLDRLKA